MTTSNQESHIRLQTIISSVQLLVLVIGVASVFMAIGQKDGQLKNNSQDLVELQDIVHELVKSQVAGATKDSEHDRVLVDLQGRVNRLETR